MGAGSSFTGIDVEAVPGVVRVWRDVGGRLTGVAQEAPAWASALALEIEAASAPAAEAARGLDLAAELLEQRAGAIASITWPSAIALMGGAWAMAGSRLGDADELVAWLATGARGYLVTELHNPTAAEWMAMVRAGTLVDGNRTMRYFDIAADPGAGVVVIDFFIPESTSLVVRGDGRGHRDPVFAALDDGDSRMVLVFDFESGRASVQVDDTCLAGVGFCNEARPIEMEGSEVVWSPSPDWGDYALPGRPLVMDLFEIPNQVSVASTRGRLELDYDVLNGIIPIGSVDGTITVTSDGAGRYSVEDMDTDRYPSIGVYQYRDGQRVEVLARQDSIGLYGAFPWVPTIVSTMSATTAAVVKTTTDALETAVETTLEVVETGVDVTVDVVETGVDVAVDVADDVADRIGDVFGGADVGDLVEDYWADNPEELVCDDVITGD